MFPSHLRGVQRKALEAYPSSAKQVEHNKKKDSARAAYFHCPLNSYVFCATVQAKPSASPKKPSTSICAGRRPKLETCERWINPLDAPTDIRDEWPLLFEQHPIDQIATEREK